MSSHIPLDTFELWRGQPIGILDNLRWVPTLSLRTRPILTAAASIAWLFSRTLEVELLLLVALIMKPLFSIIGLLGVAPATATIAAFVDFRTPLNCSRGDLSDVSSTKIHPIPIIRAVRRAMVKMAAPA